MRNHKGEMDAGSQGRTKSRGHQRKSQTDKSEENTIEILSTQPENEPTGIGIDVSPDKLEYAKKGTLSLRRKNKFTPPLGPDQLKKDIHKKLGSDMELIMKRISKEPTDNPDGKTKMKLFFNKSVYEVDTPNKGPKKNESEMKKVYKDLKESFNLLYSTDMNEQNNRLRKITCSNFYNDSFGHTDDHCKSVRGNKRSDQVGKSVKVKKEASSPKNSSQAVSKVASQFGFAKKPTLLKPEETLLAAPIPKTKATPKSVKHSIDVKNIAEQFGPLDTFTRTSTHKSSHQKASSNVEKKLERPMTFSNIKSTIPKRSQTKVSTLVNEESSVIKLKAVQRSSANDDQEQERHIPSIHRSFSNYYMKNFIKSSTKAAGEKKPYEMKETNMSDGEHSRKAKEGSLNKLSRSKSNKRTLNCSTLPTSIGEGEISPPYLIESYYSLVLDVKENRDKPIGPWLKAFILDMIKTMQDFTNRFPHGAPPPDKSVNLPAKDKRKKYTILFDLDETLVHCSFDPKHAGPRLNINKGSGNAAIQASLFVRPHAREILKELSEDYEVLVFTSSNKDYAKEVVKKLDPKMEFISFLLHRDHCNIRNNVAIKDLRIIKNRQLDKMLIIDNCVGSFGNQVANGIPILPFTVSHIRRVTAAADLLTANASTFAVADIRFCKNAPHYIAALPAN